MATKYNPQNIRNLIRGVLFPKEEFAGLQNSSCIGKDGSTKKKIVIEFSSPNIAKPFHYGHLKSTIFGNYLANLHTHLGFEVTRLNYLGDWGTQFGLLGLELKQSNCDTSQVTKLESPMSFLVQKYVSANEKAKEDEQFFNMAKEHFKSIEENPTNDNPSYVQWNQIKSLSVEELGNSYAELGINFDYYDYESNHCDEAKRMVEDMLCRGCAFRLEDGAVIVKVKKNDNIMEIPILKSDGSSLYLSRDLAAYSWRKNKFKFDKILYVAGADQARHFHALGELLKQLSHVNDATIDDEQPLIHVKTGKVIGMSTRAGKYLLLSDLIEEATSRYVISTQNTPTSKLRNITTTNDSLGNSQEIDQVAKQLALSAFFFYDLRFKRMRNYQFDWQHVLANGSNSGLNMQATHARLCSLIDRATGEANLATLKCTDEMLSALQVKVQDPSVPKEAVDLLETMFAFDETLRNCYETLESAPLVNHCIELCRAINRARQCKEMRVLGAPSNELASARAKLTLFVKAREQLALIIKLMGLQPLKKV